MDNNTQLLIYNDDDADEYSTSKAFFSLQNTGVFWCNTGTLQNDEALEKLVFLIAKKPKCLINHVQRIYYCFQENLGEQLYAALVDLLIILNKQGQAISWRMVLGTKSQLTAEQFQELKGYLKGNQVSTSRLKGNQYSVFSKGLVAVNKMIWQIENEVKEDDPLMIALDYIEYSQMDEAKAVLQEAILLQPEKMALHQELFDLYKLTGGL